MTLFDRPPKLWQRYKRALDAAKGFDCGRWGRLALLLISFPMSAAVGGWVLVQVGAASATPLPGLLPGATWTWGCAAITVYFVALTLYYAHLLFARLQCSLVELLALVVLLGSAEGLLFSTPGILYVPHLLIVIAAALPALVFAGAIEGLIEARVLDVTHPYKRLLIVLVDIFADAGPSVGLAGFLLWGSRFTPLRGLGGLDLTAWGLPMLIVGGVSTVAGFALGLKVRRVAHRLLDET